MKAFIFVGIVAISGCASGTSARYNYMAQSEAFSIPPVGTIGRATIGSELLSKGRTADHDVLTLNDTVQIGGYTLTPGSYGKSGSEAGVHFYSVSEVAGQAWADGSPRGYLQRSLMTDPISTLRYTPASNEVCVLTVLGIPRCGNARNASLEKRTSVSSQAFEQTLLYNGKVGNTLNIAYREFSAGMARDAFSNEVQYDLSSSEMIAYKGAQLRVIEADNTSITYEVISNFD